MSPNTRILLVCNFLLAPLLGFARPPGCPLSSDIIAEMPKLGAAGLSPDFRAWLADNGYDPSRYARDDLEGGSFGGRQSGTQILSNQPGVFVHGNSDRAVGENMQGPVGWTAVIRQFMAAGYTPAELYATTWGPADPDKAGNQVHSAEHVQHIRGFIEAVLAYTRAEHLDVIGHSMGVTLARRAT